MSPDSRTAASSPGSASNVLADEAALKRAFDAEFATCLASAQTQLGDAGALAPRVVETTFVSAWNQRATIQTAEQLKGVLADEIRHGAARALSRRISASRFAGGKQTTSSHAAASVSPADVWAGVQKAIHATGGADAHAAAADTGRHEAASHMRMAAKKKSWAIPIALAVIAVAISVAGVLYVDRLGEDDAILAAVGNAGIQPISSSSGQIGTTKLSDGTVVRFGPDTKIYIADGFPKKIRALKVDGTAQFEVAPVTKEQPLPFRVVAKRVHVIATGTNFAVSAYPNDSGMMVQVKEGSVTLKGAGMKAPSTVGAGQTLLVDKGASRAPSAEELAQGFGWVNGQITVQHKQLRAVVAALTRWFNYDVKVTDLPLLDRDASIDVPLDSSRLAISQVEKSANVKFAYEGETKVFRDAAKKK